MYEFARKYDEVLTYLVDARIVGRILEISINNLMISDIRKEIRESCEIDVEFGIIPTEGKLRDVEKV